MEKKPLAFCAGIGVTALVSSNATTMLVTSFVAQDLVALAPALVMVPGADGDGADGEGTDLRPLPGYRR